jgi:hypothetical protein
MGKSMSQSKVHNFHVLSNDELENLLDTKSEANKIIHTDEQVDSRIMNFYYTHLSFCEELNVKDPKYIKDAPLLKSVFKAAINGEIPSLIYNNFEKNSKQITMFSQKLQGLEDKYPTIAINSVLLESYIPDSKTRVDKTEGNKIGNPPVSPPAGLYSRFAGGLAYGLNHLWSAAAPATEQNTANEDKKAVEPKAVPVEQKVKPRAQQPLPSYVAQISAKKEGSVERD